MALDVNSDQVTQPLSPNGSYHDWADTVRWLPITLRRSMKIPVRFCPGIATLPMSEAVRLLFNEPSPNSVETR